jgi:hypothetical protein
MKYDQKWFNDKYPNKKEREIKLKYEDFQGQLIVKDYLQLEKLHLRNVENIDKIILKDLPQLQNCTI